jgi:hypothetical protein
MLDVFFKMYAAHTILSSEFRILTKPVFTTWYLPGKYHVVNSGSFLSFLHRFYHRFLVLTSFNQLILSVVKPMENTGKYRPVNVKMVKSRKTALV